MALLVGVCRVKCSTSSNFRLSSTGLDPLDSYTREFVQYVRLISSNESELPFELLLSRISSNSPVIGRATNYHIKVAIRSSRSEMQQVFIFNSIVSNNQSYKETQQITVMLH